MAYIKYLNREEIPESNQVNDDDHIIRIHSVHSEVMKHHHSLYRELMYGRGPLSRIQREMIAIVVSSINECHYWIEHHGAGLRRLLTSKKVSTHEQNSILDDLFAVGDYPSLSAQDNAILCYAAKLTRSPANIGEDDIKQLRFQDIDDRGIHDICAITAYFAFVNRMADGLGVELEPDSNKS